MIIGSKFHIPYNLIVSPVISSFRYLSGLGDISKSFTLRRSIMYANYTYNKSNSMQMARSYLSFTESRVRCLNEINQFHHNGYLSI